MEITMQDPVQDGDGDGDRLSGLPDRIVHRIISFLTLKDLARLSFASRRCQELCNSTPTLSLSNIDLLKPDDILCRLSINAFLHGLMLHRCSHRVKMQSLSLRWSFQHSLPDEQYRVWSWLQHAVNSDVGEFNLNITGKPFSLPVCVLGCESLRSLVVNTNNGILRFPSTLSLSYGSSSTLRTLILESVRMEDDGFQQWLPSLKFLKVLSLSKVSRMKSMRITSSSIEKLIIRRFEDLCHIQIQEVEKLHELYIVWRFNNCGGKSLEISAPNLQRFLWVGYAVDYFCMRSSSHLWLAAINLLPPANQPRGREDACKANFDKLLRSIHSAKNLILHIEFVEILLKHGCLPFSLDNLETLTIRRSTRISGHQVQALSSVFAGTTKLNHLIMSAMDLILPNPHNSASDSSLPFKMGYWESQGLMLTHQVKKITMELPSGENELELTKYLLKSAKKLEEMTISYSSPSPLPSYFFSELTEYKKPFTKLHLHPQSKILGPYAR